MENLRRIGGHNGCPYVLEASRVQDGTWVARYEIAVFSAISKVGKTEHTRRVKNSFPSANEAVGAAEVEARQWIDENT